AIDDEDTPKGVDVLDHVGVAGSEVEDPKVLALAWEALYTAHASGPDAGARLEVPTAVLRLLHFAGWLADDPSPEVADAEALLTARVAIAPELDVALRGMVGKPSRAASGSSAPDLSASEGAKRARELAADIASATALQERLRSPVTERVSSIDAEPPQPVGSFTGQRFTVRAASALSTVLGSDVSRAHEVVLDELGLTPATPSDVAAQRVDGHLTALNEEALARAHDPGFRAGLLDLAKTGKLGVGVFVPMPLPAAPDPSTAPDVDVHGRIKPLGIGDLKVVKQTLLDYEPGEIAYIENVLKGESRSRVFRTLNRTETTLFASEEDTRDQERDTQATDRFELKREAAQTIKEDMSVKAGLSVTASYGPISATATGDFAYATSKEDSQKSSSNFAHDVVDRSITKVQSKVTTQRTTTTLNEQEETNTHGIDNKAGSGHVVGIYRWLDKRYRAQIYNYGIRMMLEFVVPEPAAFFRAAHVSKVKVDATPPADFVNDLEPMQPPGGARRLAARDIKISNYDRYAARYGATGIAAPPPLIKVVGATLETDGLDDGKSIAKSTPDLAVPDGYSLMSYSLAASVLWNNFPKFTVQVGSDSYEILNDPSDGNSQVNNASRQRDLPGTHVTDPPVSGIVPVSVAAYDVHAFTCNVKAVCVRTDDLLQAWRLQTYDKIAAAYQALQTTYDQKVAQAQAAAADTIQGQNPAINQSVVQTELKKLCLTMMTGQHFSQFHAVTTPDDPPTHFPEIDVDEALREGPIVQFLEQAFEWEQMTYLFYPYFWGHKAGWVAQAALSDPDPAFAQFLTAGSARVVVPVPVAYSDAVLYMLQSPAADLASKVWSGGEPPTLDSDLYRSLAQELKARTDDLDGATPEGDPWEYTLPTTLVLLQDDDRLPTFA
ncbi:MAG TPA: hypothetical protein VFY45_22315, partial [Baekduia sp.]|nr:hypothetical protein [Baekduia sp.]